jgi:hypothetical protein
MTRTSKEGVNVFNIAQINTTQPPDWAPTPEQIAQIKRALKNEAYPPAGRSGVGPVTRQVAA